MDPGRFPPAGESLQGGTGRGHAGPLKVLDPQIKLHFGVWLKLDDPSLRRLEAAGIGEVCARLDPRDVPVGQSPLIFPEREAGERGAAPGNAHGLLPLGSHQKGGRHSLRRGADMSVMDLLGPARLGRSVAVPGGHIGLRTGIAGGQFRHIGHQFRPCPEQRRPKVDVVEHLERRGPIREILHAIAPLNGGSVGPQRERCRHAEVVTQKPGFIDCTTQLNCARITVEQHREFMGRKVGDLPMQAVLQAAGGGEVRRPVAHQPAASHQFIKSIQPPQPGRLCQRHEAGMHRTANRGLPPQFHLSAEHFPDAQAPIGQDEHAGCPRHQFDQPHSLAHSPPQPPHNDSQGSGAMRQIIGGNPTRPIQNCQHFHRKVPR